MSFEELKTAVDDYFSDTSRSKRETLDGLCSALCSIEILIETLEEEIQNEQEHD